MLLQVTVFIESFVTLSALLRRLPKSGVFAPCVRNMGIFNLGLYLIFFGIGRICKYFSCGKCEKTMETDENIMNHMRKCTLQKKHMIVKINPMVVSLNGGQSYAFSCGIFNKIICHTGYIFTAPSKIGCLRPQCEKHVGFQYWTLP